jgi:hypothetical protein
MAKVKKDIEDPLMERLFGHLKTGERGKLDLTKIAEIKAEIKAEEPHKPVPKKQLVPKRILIIEPDQRCMNVLAKNWAKLKEIVAIRETPFRTFRAYNSEDVMIETFEYVIRDEQVKGASEEEIIDLFTYRFDNLMWSAKMDKALERQILARGEIDPVTFGSDNEKTK